MQDREARKKFMEIQQYMQESPNAEEWLKMQERLQNCFGRINQLITTYAEKKYENEKVYEEGLQRALTKMLELTSKDIENVDNLMNVKVENWERLNHKMQIFMMLKQNLKQMFSLGNKNYNNSNLITNGSKHK